MPSTAAVAERSKPERVKISTFEGPVISSASDDGITVYSRGAESEAGPAPQAAEGAATRPSATIKQVNLAKKEATPSPLHARPHLERMSRGFRIAREGTR